MKKLILVTLLAVAASWLLSDGPRTEDRPATPTLALALDDGPPPRPARKKHRPGPPNPPGSIRTVPWRPASNRPDPRPGPTPAGKAAPSWFPTSEDEEVARAKADVSGARVLLGRLSASEDRARRDLRQIVERAVADWLAADVPPSWKTPAPVVASMARGSYTQEVTKSLIPAAPEAEAEAGSTAGQAELPGLDGLYTLYRSGQQLDFSPSRRAEIVGMYRRDLAAGRMHRLGGGLALALVGLAVLSGYIKADEATKGYYTNRLRLVAAAGLGAAGVAAYRFLI